MGGCFEYIYHQCVHHCYGGVNRYTIIWYNIWNFYHISNAWGQTDRVCTYVLQSPCSTVLCSPVPMFPSPDVHRPSILHSLYAPIPFSSPMGMPYVSQYLCSPVPLFSSTYALQHLSFPVPIFPRSAFTSLCSQNIFPSLYVPQFLYPWDPFLPKTPILIFPRTVSSAYVTQRCSPVPMLPSPYIPLDLWFPSPDVPHKCFQSLCSLKIFPSLRGHLTLLKLQHLWPRPPGVWLGGPGCKPGHSGWS